MDHGYSVLIISCVLIDPTDHLMTEVTELQILREHSGFVTAICAAGTRTLVSACTGDGNGSGLLVHVFPEGEVYSEDVCIFTFRESKCK